MRLERVSTTGKTHATVGVATTVALVILNPQGFDLWGAPVLPTISLVTAAVGSYLPDIDIHQSAMGQRHKFISKRLKHRGFTHTLVIPSFFLVFMQAIVYFMIIVSIATLLNSLLFGLLLGWVLHIFADLFNRKGVPLLYPFTKKHFHIMSIKTGHIGEYLWLAAYLCVLIAITVTNGGFL